MVYGWGMTEEKKKPVGGQTKYRDDFPDRIEAYVENFAAQGDEIPTVAALSVILGVTRETIHVWDSSGEYPELSNMLCKLRAVQERELMNKGLNGKFNAPITKLALHKHGYTDKVEQDNTSSDGSMRTPSSSDLAIIENALKKLGDKSNATTDKTRT